MKKPTKKSKPAPHKKGASPKMLTHLKKLNLARRKAKKTKKPVYKDIKGKKIKPTEEAVASTPNPAVIPPSQLVGATIPASQLTATAVKLPKGDCPGQTVMPAVEAACSCCEQPPNVLPGEEML